MNDIQFKKKLDEIYETGFRNGRIDMKNKIMKSLSRDWKLFTFPPDVNLMMKILKKINRLK